MTTLSLAGLALIFVLIFAGGAQHNPNQPLGRLAAQVLRLMFTYPKCANEVDGAGLSVVMLKAVVAFGLVYPASDLLVAMGLPLISRWGYVAVWFALWLMLVGLMSWSVGLETRQEERARRRTIYG